MVLGFVNAMPGLITVALIVVVMRVVIRLVTLFFDAVERGHGRGFCDGCFRTRPRPRGRS